MGLEEVEFDGEMMPRPVEVDLHAGQVVIHPRRGMAGCEDRIEELA